MTVISDFAAKQTAFNTQLETAVAGLSDDVDSLNAKILELQNSAGGVTAEDQALLDQLTVQGQTIADKFTALDALTPPAVPVTP